MRQLQTPKTIVDCNFCVTNQRVKFDMQRYYARKRSSNHFVRIEIALVPGPGAILYQAQIQRCTPCSKCRRYDRRTCATVSHTVQVESHLPEPALQRAFHDYTANLQSRQLMIEAS